MRILILIGCLLTAGTFCFADEWEFFYPSTVTAYGCTARVVSVQAHGEKRTHDAWQAEAHATRNAAQGNWGLTLGEYPPNDKGRDSAEKACFKWMRQASKRVKAAR